jgi:hypothetical protein
MSQHCNSTVVKGEQSPSLNSLVVRPFKQIWKSPQACNRHILNELYVKTGIQRNQ